jgi:hypothetical protein
LAIIFLNKCSWGLERYAASTREPAKPMLLAPTHLWSPASPVSKRRDNNKNQLASSRSALEEEP